MSLLCAYSDSSSGSEDEDAPQSFVNTTAPSAPALPSVDDLFSSNNSSSVLSSSVGSRYSASSSAVDASKRRAQSNLRAQEPKRPKTAEIPAPPPPTATKPQKPLAKHFAPPQLKRPNVSTEDLGAWNTQKTMQHHDRKLRDEI